MAQAENPSEAQASSNSRPPRYVPGIIGTRTTAIISFVLIGVAVGLEVALRISWINGGFPIETNRKGTLDVGYTQFLTAFFPTLGIALLLRAWEMADQAYKEFQPYVVLAQGNASAEDGLLLNYMGLRPFSTLRRALKYKHGLIFLSSITALAGGLLQPLAGSVFQIRPISTSRDATVVSTHIVGLSPDADRLNGFVAAAGFAEAAVFHSLPDPPFIQDGWAAAEFEFPTNPGLNGSIIVRTAAVQTSPNCANPTSSELATPGTTNFTIRGTSAQGCTQSITFDPTKSNTQYGVLNVPNCGTSTDVRFQPVMFWYFHRRADNGTAEARSVFCTPTIKVINIQAQANLNNGSLARVTPLSDFSSVNNVTGSPMSGQAFNAVSFLPSNDSFVQARALATSSSVSGAIFRFASQLPNGPQSTFDDPNGFLNITNRVYTQHLAIAAKATYFLTTNQTIPATMISIVPRLWIEPLSAHALAVILILIAFVAIFLRIAHGRQRRNVYLTCPPGSIGHSVALTAQSGLGKSVMPFDDEDTLIQKFSGMKFRLDSRTGAIVVDDAKYGTGPDEVSMALLAQGSPSPGSP